MGRRMSREKMELLRGAQALWERDRADFLRTEACIKKEFLRLSALVKGTGDRIHRSEKGYWRKLDSIAWLFKDVAGLDNLPKTVPTFIEKHGKKLLPHDNPAQRKILLQKWTKDMLDNKVTTFVEVARAVIMNCPEIIETKFATGHLRILLEESLRARERRLDTLNETMAQRKAMLGRISGMISIMKDHLRIMEEINRLFDALGGMPEGDGGRWPNPEAIRRGELIRNAQQRIEEEIRKQCNEIQDERQRLEGCRKEVDRQDESGRKVIERYFKEHSNLVKPMVFVLKNIEEMCRPLVKKIGPGVGPWEMGVAKRNLASWWSERKKPGQPDYLGRVPPLDDLDAALALLGDHAEVLEAYDFVNRAREERTVIEAELEKLKEREEKIRSEAGAMMASRMATEKEKAVRQRTAMDEMSKRMTAALDEYTRVLGRLGSMGRSLGLYQTPRAGGTAERSARSEGPGTAVFLRSMARAIGIPGLEDIDAGTVRQRRLAHAPGGNGPVVSENGSPEKATMIPWEAIPFVPPASTGSTVSPIQAVPQTGNAELTRAPAQDTEAKTDDQGLEGTDIRPAKIQYQTDLYSFENSDRGPAKKDDKQTGNKDRRRSGP